MRILVTGGAGYIGSFTTRALQAAGHDVVIYDNLVYGHQEAIDAELIVADLADQVALHATLNRGFDAIVHFAAYIETGESMIDAARFFANNTGNTISLLNTAVQHGIDKFVFSSSAGVYGSPAIMPVTEDVPAVPESPYAESKLLVERMLPWYETVHGLRSMSLRYFNASGAALDGSMGQDHEPATHLITVAIKAALGQRDFPLYGDDYATPDGTCIRDYIHVLDLATAHVLALEHLAAGGDGDIFNVGTGVGSSNREVVEAVKRASGVDFPVTVAPRRPGDPVALVADAGKLSDALGWHPQYSDLDTVATSAWKWHSSHPYGYSSSKRERLSVGQ